MASPAPVQLHTLFADLQRCGISGDHEKGIKIATKILKEEQTNLKAIQCKVVSFIHLGDFENAITQIDAAKGMMIASSAGIGGGSGGRGTPTASSAGPTGDQPPFQLEKAYSLYRLNRVQEAYDLLKSIPSPDNRVKELTAQVLYRLERFDEAYDIYLELIKNSADEYESERWTNLAAVMANMSRSGPSSSSSSRRKLPEIDEETVKTYELRYNKACVLLADCRLEEAKRELEASEAEGRQTLEEEGATEEEIETDLALIRAQLGYVYQAMGDEPTALKIYNQLLKSQRATTDVALLAVASNNAVSINKDLNVFDSKKKIKMALNEIETNKLISAQKRTILYNNALLLLYMNQRDASRRQLDDLLARFPVESAADVAIVRAAILVREKRLDQATELLETSLEAHGTGNVSGSGPGPGPGSVSIALALGQILLMQGHVARACDVLRTVMGSDLRLGVVSSLVSLYLSLSDRESVTGVLTDCVAKLRREQRKDRLAIQLIQENAKYFLDAGQVQKAIDLLEDLRRLEPKNPKLLSQLIAAYSQVDQEKAKEVSKDLPAIEDIIKSVDVETLESASWSLGTKYARKSARLDPTATATSTTAASSGTGGPDAGPGRGRDGKKGANPTSAPASVAAVGGDADKVAKKSRRKKKRPLPKNYDPTCDPDPERWLPKWQRSTFKKKRDKRGEKSSIGKGTQGSTADVEIPIPKKSTTQPIPAAGPRQQRPGGQGKAKKKTKGRR